MLSLSPLSSPVATTGRPSPLRYAGSLGGPAPATSTTRYARALGLPFPPCETVHPNPSLPASQWRKRDSPARVGYASHAGEVRRLRQPPGAGAAPRRRAPAVLLCSGGTAVPSATLLCSVRRKMEMLLVFVFGSDLGVIKCVFECFAKLVGCSLLGSPLLSA